MPYTRESNFIEIVNLAVAAFELELELAVDRAHACRRELVIKKCAVLFDNESKQLENEP